MVPSVPEIRGKGRCPKSLDPLPRCALSQAQAPPSKADAILLGSLSLPGRKWEKKPFPSLLLVINKTTWILIPFLECVLPTRPYAKHTGPFLIKGIQLCKGGNYESEISDVLQVLKTSDRFQHTFLLQFPGIRQPR